MARNTNVAVFIDAENVGAGNAKQIFDEASNYGDIVVKRIFADWSKTALKSWREEINRYSITAEQQFGIVSKKNCSDIALIIQTMVVLFEKDVDVFCLVSGDSDFTRLVQELRERNKTVVGMIIPFVSSFCKVIIKNGISAGLPVFCCILIRPAIQSLEGTVPAAEHRLSAGWQFEKDESLSSVKNCASMKFITC